MKQMYVISMSSGSYEEYDVSVVAITDDLEAGQKYVDNANALYESLNQKTKSFYEKEYIEWQNVNPRPAIKDVQGLKYIPKWPSHVKVTKDMREERQALKDYNANVVQKASEATRAWGQAMLDFQESWLNENLTVDENELRQKIRYCDNHRWEIEPVAWL